MAETKSTSEKTKIPEKVKSTPEPAVPLRRSPRKATQSAKKVGAEDVPNLKIIAKRSSPSKRKALSKNTSLLKRASTLAKGSKKATTALMGPSDSPSVNLLNSPSTKTSASASPRARGRPRKHATGAVPAVKGRQSESMATSSRPESMRSGASTEAYAPITDDHWTDSLSKKVTAERRSRATTLSCNSSTDDIVNHLEEALNGVEDTATRQASVGGIKKSIEVPSPTRATSGPLRSPSRKTAKNPTRISTSPSTKTRGRSASVRTVGPPKASRSKSPLKPVAQTFTKGSGASPSRKASNNSLGGRPKSPIQARPVSPIRPQSPARIRGRSPVKPTSQTGSPRRSDNSFEHVKRSSSKSPKKASGTASPRWRSSESVKAPDQIRSKSPKKLAAAQAASAGHTAFIRNFTADDEYGTALRTTESKAYRAQKVGQVFVGHDPVLSNADEDCARARGVERAEQESALRMFDNREQRIRDGYNQRLVRLPSASRSRSPRRRRNSSLYDEHEDEDGKHLPGRSARDDSSENELAGSSTSSSLGQSQKERKASKDSGSPRTTSRGQSSRSRRLSAPKDEDTSLPPGQSSWPKRGPIHSMTNPEFVPCTDGKRRNPFFETMPGPEIWHRRMPAYFPFGETRFMEQEMSRQISEDLARGKEEGAAKNRQSSGLIGRTMSAVASGVSSGVSTVGNAFGFSKTPAMERPHKSPWDLPEVTDSNVKEGLKSVRKVQRSETKTDQKRKASDPSNSRPPKRVRRRSSGDSNYFMSGALH